jgi:hypothetical protein
MLDPKELVNASLEIISQTAGAINAVFYLPTSAANIDSDLFIQTDRSCPVPELSTAHDARKYIRLCQSTSVESDHRNL